MRLRTKMICVLRVPHALSVALAVLTGMAASAISGCGGTGKLGEKPPPPQQAAVPVANEAGDLRIGVGEPLSEGQLSVIGLRHFLMYSHFLSLGAAPGADGCEPSSGECASGGSGNVGQVGKAENSGGAVHSPDAVDSASMQR